MPLKACFCYVYLLYIQLNKHKMSTSENTMAIELLFGVLSCVAYAVAVASLREHRKREGENTSGSVDVWMILSFLFLASLYFARVLLVQFCPSFMVDYRTFVNQFWLLPSLVLALIGLCKGRNPLKSSRSCAYANLGLLLLAQALQFFIPASWAFICGQLLVMGGQGFWYYYVLRKVLKRDQLYPKSTSKLSVLSEAPQSFIGQIFNESPAGQCFAGGRFDEMGVAGGSFVDDESLDAFYLDLNDRLLRLFEEEKPYLTPRVNVMEVARKIGTNKTYVSALLNKYMNQNFNQFVNAYRVREAQDYVKKHGRIALPSLCRTVGFHSMASFTVAFRLNTGMTPGEWCKQYKMAT